MTRIIYMPALILLILVSGCMEFANTRVASISEIDQWIEWQNFGKALEAAHQHQKNQPSTEIANKIDEINKKAEQLDITKSQDIYELINNQNITEARNKLKQALDLYPQGTRLNAIDAHLKNTQSTQISRLQAQQLLAKSEWLLRANEIKSSLQSIKPESNGTFLDPTEDMQETAAELYHLGLKALQKNDLELADSCLTMSNKLYPRRFTASAIARLELLREKERQKNIINEKQVLAQKRVEEIEEHKQNQEENKKLQQQQLAQKQQKFEVIYYETVSLLKDNQLSMAKSNLEKLNTLLPDNDKLIPLNKEFADKLPAHVEALINRGRQLYINGKIAKARDIWIKALKLDPENEQITKSIERANRVLGRLDELKKAKP